MGIEDQGLAILIVGVVEVEHVSMPSVRESLPAARVGAIGGHLLRGGWRSTSFGGEIFSEVREPDQMKLNEYNFAPLNSNLSRMTLPVASE